MLNKDLVLRRAAEAAAGIVNQGTTKSFLEETSFFPAPNKTGPVLPPAREESQVVNGEKPKVGNAAAQKWDEILPQGVDLWTRKKESEQKSRRAKLQRRFSPSNQTPPRKPPLYPTQIPKMAVLISKKSHRLFRRWTKRKTEFWPECLP